MAQLCGIYEALANPLSNNHKYRRQIKGSENVEIKNQMMEVAEEKSA